MVEVMNRPAKRSDLDAMAAGTLLTTHDGSKVTDAPRFVPSYILPLAPNDSIRRRALSFRVRLSPGFDIYPNTNAVTRQISRASAKSSREDYVVCGHTMVS